MHYVLSQERIEDDRVSVNRDAAGNTSSKWRRSQFRVQVKLL